MSAMAIETCIPGKLREAVGVNPDRVFVTPEIGGTPAEPNDAVGGLWILLVEFARVVEFCFQVAPRFRGKLGDNFARRLQTVCLRGCNRAEEENSEKQFHLILGT